MLTDLNMCIFRPGSWKALRLQIQLAWAGGFVPGAGAWRAALLALPVARRALARAPGARRQPPGPVARAPAAAARDAAAPVAHTVKCQELRVVLHLDSIFFFTEVIDVFPIKV